MQQRMMFSLASNLKLCMQEIQSKRITWVSSELELSGLQLQLLMNRKMFQKKQKIRQNQVKKKPIGIMKLYQQENGMIEKLSQLVILKLHSLDWPSELVDLLLLLLLCLWFAASSLTERDMLSLMELEEPQVLLEEDLKLLDKASVVRKDKSKETLSTQILSIQMINQLTMYIKTCLRTWTKLLNQMMPLKTEL
jgi:hypothetical protein